MKQTFIKIVSKKVLVALLVSGTVLFAAPSIVKANPKNIEILSANSQATVKFTGASDNALSFEVKVANANGDKFTVTVADKDGDILYSDDFKDKNFDKKFKLLKSDDIAGYIFKITSANKNLEQTFAVNATTKIVDDVEITKL